MKRALELVGLAGALLVAAPAPLAAQPDAGGPGEAEAPESPGEAPEPEGAPEPEDRAGPEPEDRSGPRDATRSERPAERSEPNRPAPEPEARPEPSPAPNPYRERRERGRAPVDAGARRMTDAGAAPGVPAARRQRDGAVADPASARPDAAAGSARGSTPAGPASESEAAESPPDEDEAPPSPSFIPWPVPSDSSSDDDGVWELLRKLVPVLPESRTGSALGLALAIVLAALGASIARRMREVVPARGVLPRLLQLVHTLLRLGVVGLSIALVVRVLPPWMGPALPWVLLAAAAAIGWSARDLLPDLVAGMVVLFERRIRPGVWISGDDFSGTVVGAGLRATWVVDARGHRIAVPNRRLLSGPIVSDTAFGAEHEVTLRMDVPAPAGRVRQALNDAVLQSPWVPPGAAPVVLRDPDEPHLWHVRSRLLEARYAPRFEGELLERAEENLASTSRSTFPLDEELDDA